MPNTSLSPLDREHINTELAILRLMLNLIDAICYEDNKLAQSYMLNDVKAEIQYTVEVLIAKLNLDNQNN